MAAEELVQTQDQNRVTLLQEIVHVHLIQGLIHKGFFEFEYFHN